MDHVAIPVAFAAGLISFLSPCVLPLVPGYLGAIAGTRDMNDLSARNVVGPTLTFIGSFSAIYIALTLLGQRAIRGAFTGGTAVHVCGAMIVVMGLLYIAAPFVPKLNPEYHVPALMEKARGGGPVIIGVAFAIAWTPCVGPTLGTIVGLASTSRSAAAGAILMAIYCIGLGVPFLITGLAFGKVAALFNIVKRHYPVVIITGGAVLVAVGIFVWTGEFDVLNAQASNLMQALHLPNLSLNA